MQPDTSKILERAAGLAFPATRTLLTDPPEALRALTLPSGHQVWYGPQGRRLLATDPTGHLLHECEWGGDPPNGARLLRARVRLDWGQWVGLKPGGMVRSTRLPLASRPGGQRLTADDLRRVAAQAMRVPLDEVRFFYPDEDLTIDPSGEATIRHRKDALYVLDDDGTFERARFMACMGAMHWDAIDFLPVVELFQSLLPGTGSAIFELIRGLYDDQNPGSPRPLRYRGIPTYPSESAYRLFSTCFVPGLAGGGDPFPVFMDPGRSHEVTWLPDPAPPLRYVEEDPPLCLTIKSGVVQKVTRIDDPSGLAYVAPPAAGPAPGGRSVTVASGALELREDGRSARLPLRPVWGKLREHGSGAGPTASIGWRAVLGDRFPAVAPRDAFGAVLLYPEDDAPIDELASQPFVADYLHDLFDEEHSGLGAVRNRARRVLIDSFDAALASCVSLDAGREQTILYRHPAHVQKFAQSLWTRLARRNRLDLATTLRFVPEATGRERIPQAGYDLILAWSRFDRFEDRAGLTAWTRQLARALAPGGVICAAGPEPLAGMLAAEGLRVHGSIAVQELPTFQVHLGLLPEARLKPGLTLVLGGA